MNHFYFAVRARVRTYYASDFSNLPGVLDAWTEVTIYAHTWGKPTPYRPLPFPLKLYYIIYFVLLLDRTHQTDISEIFRLLDSLVTRLVPVDNTLFRIRYMWWRMLLCDGSAVGA